VVFSFWKNLDFLVKNHEFLRKKHDFYGFYPDFYNFLLADLLPITIFATLVNSPYPLISSRNSMHANYFEVFNLLSVILARETLRPRFFYYQELMSIAKFTSHFSFRWLCILVRHMNEYTEASDACVKGILSFIVENVECKHK